MLDLKQFVYTVIISIYTKLVELNRELGLGLP